MISVQEAISLVRKNVVSLSPVLLPLEKAYSLTLAEDVTAHMDIPAFAQSSMDGYAFSFADWKKDKKLFIKGEVPAGSAKDIVLAPSRAVRIFTGAAVPEGVDTVVMQEKVVIENDELLISDNHISPGDNVRPAGSEIKAGDLALENNSNLSPAAIGFLAAIGIKEVVVYPKPSVSIITTGDELRLPGSPLRKGQVYESATYFLKAALNGLYIENLKIHRLKDDADQLIKTLEKALNESDIVLLVGGISVGDYDFVLKAVTSCGVRKIFHKVKQKPGKPLYFGKTDSSIVFGLPGNPSSSLTCIYEYVIPAIDIMTNKKDTIKISEGLLTVDYLKKTELTLFLKGHIDNDRVTPLGAQESYRLRSYAKANCLIKMGEGKKEFKKGNSVEVHLIPD